MVVMKQEIFRMVFGVSLSMVVGLAAAQDRGSRGSSSGGSHTSGGGVSTSGGGGFRSSGGGYSSGGGVSRSTGGGYSSRGTGYGSNGTYRSSGSGTTSGQSSNGYSRYGGGGYSSRYQSHTSIGNQGSTRGDTTTSRASSGSEVSRYSNQNRTVGANSSGANSSNRTNGFSSGYGYRDSSVGSAFTRGHADAARGGINHYSGNNNLNGSTGHQVYQEHFNTAPHGLIGGGSTLGHVLGNNNVGLVNGGYRHGYYGYNGGWRDSFFSFGFYCFDPFFAPCYVSPWYYYPCLPGYIAAPQVIIVDRYPSAGWSGSDYDWEPAPHERPNPVLDNSIQDIISSFESDDHNALNRLVPHSGEVNIYVDGKYSYSLKSNDFYDTYLDGIESTKTDRYEILDVKAKEDGTAKVVAKHAYNDPWGNRTYVYHTYFLVKEGDEYVIREFGTSDYRTGW